MSGFELRAHHALCARFFRGKGYSPPFVENMSRIVGTLRTSDPLLTLRSGADVLCGRCPHDRDGVCESADKVARYDAAVLRLLALDDGAQLRWSELSRLTEERILGPGRLGAVCGDCQWHGICATLAQEKK